MKWNDGDFPAALSAWASQAKLRESLDGIVATVSSGVCTEMAENRTQDGRFRCQFEKNGGFAAFLTAKPSVLLRNSVLGLKVNQQW